MVSAFRAAHEHRQLQLLVEIMDANRSLKNVGLLVAVVCFLQGLEHPVFRLQILISKVHCRVVQQSFKNS